MTYEPTTPNPHSHPAAKPQGGAGMATVALLVGLFGCIVWLLPINESGIRHYLPLPFAVGGIVLSVLCLSSHRRGTVAAVIGLLLSVLALILGTIMVANEFLRFIP
jgi:hypothetical protein